MRASGLSAAYFAGATNRHLYDDGGTRCQDEHQQRTDDAKAAIIIAPPAKAAKEHAELREHGNSAGNGGGCGYGHRQRVMIADMAEFVTDDASDFFAVEGIKEPRRRTDGGVLLRIAPGGERIGLRAVHQIDPRRRQAGPLCQFAYNCHQFRHAALVDFLCAVHR